MNNNVKRNMKSILKSNLKRLCCSLLAVIMIFSSMSLNTYTAYATEADSIASKTVSSNSEENLVSDLNDKSDDKSDDKSNEKENSDMNSDEDSVDEAIEDLDLEMDETNYHVKNYDPYLSNYINTDDSIKTLEDGSLSHTFSAASVYSDSLSGCELEADSVVYNAFYKESLSVIQSFDNKVSLTFSKPGSITGDEFSDIMHTCENAYSAAIYSSFDYSYAIDTTSCSASRRMSGGVTYVTVTVNVSYYEDPFAMVDAVKYVFHECIKPGMTDLEKALSFHDYLCFYVIYDQSLTRRNAYDALVKKSCVCQGYYEAYRLLMNYAKIPNATAVEPNHIWNLIYINGSWFNVDCTWDSGAEFSVYHENFLVSDVQASKNGHSPSSQDYTCSNRTYDNYKWYGTSVAQVVFESATCAYYLDYDFDGRKLYLMQINPLTGAKSEIASVKESGMVKKNSSGSYSVFQENAFKMVYVNGVIYFNDSQNTYKVGPDKVLTRTGGISADSIGQYIYAVRNDGEMLYTYLKRLNQTDFITGKVIPVYTVPRTSSNIQAFAERMYTVALGRKAETTGLAYWTIRLINHKVDGAGIANGFIGSDEFTKRNLSNDEFVNTLYRTFFNREPDAGGKANWLKELNSGKNRKYVLAGFVNSLEFANLCDKYGIARGTMESDGSSLYNPGVRDFVLRMYTKCLKRTGETTGVEDWAHRINTKQMTPEQVAKEFFNSAEFTNKKLSNSDYVETLYETFMDRASDAGGKADWVSKLNSGTSRQVVLEGFSRSPEFARIMADFGL